MDQEKYIVVEQIIYRDHENYRGEDCFLEKVNNRIAEGYIPLGGIAITNSETFDDKWYQAMVLKEVIK